MKIQALILAAGLSMFGAVASAQIVSIPAAAAVQAVTLQSASQVIADSKGGTATATAPALTQTAEISSAGLPSGTVVSASSPTVTVAGSGSAQATISQTAQALTVIPVIQTGVSTLATVPAIQAIVN